MITLPRILNPYPWSMSPEEGDVTCLLLGDINLQNRNHPELAFKHIDRTLRAVDLRYANLEGCLYKPGTEDIPSKFNWRHSDESMVRALTAVGIDAVGCANNVTLGHQATVHSLGVLDRAGIMHCGAGRTRAEAWHPVVLEKAGVRFGFVQVTARIHDEKQPALDDRPGVAYFDPDDRSQTKEVIGAVESLRPEVDVLVFSHHLRNTGTTAVEDYQRELAASCIGAGADIFYGHGAHVNQSVEIIDGRCVFHCVGQLAFDWSTTSHHRDGLVIRLVVRKKKIVDVAVVPVFRDEDNTVYLANPNDGEGKRQYLELKNSAENVDVIVRDGEIRVSS